jgi:2-iminobutanoate/2-iminopropanoate deaminase
MLQVVSTDNAPRAIGPYSQAVKCNGFVYISGQIPIDPAHGVLVTGPIAEQTIQVLKNLKAILEQAGSSVDRVIKTTVFLRDMKDFDEMNRVYGEFFKENKPARATIAVAGLPKDASIEIEAVAAV